MLTQTLFRSEDLPAADRFDAWCDLMGQSHAPMQMTSEFAADFKARQSVIALGEVTVYPTTFQQVVFRRTPKLIRQSDPETYHLSLLVSGAGGARWDRREATYHPGNFHSNSTSAPFEVISGSESVTIIGLEVPRSQLLLPSNRADQVIGLHLSGQEGVGALLAQFLTQLAADTSPYHPTDAPRLSTVIAHLTTALFAHTLDADAALPPESRRRTLFLRAQAFLRHNLTDPELTPDQVAAALHISRSYLYQLFRQEGTTVAGYLRRLRLEAAHRDLADPAQRTTPVHTVAARWGFRHASDFTRAFRTAYGISPTDHRHHAAKGTAM
ncbi:AraC family transcriptional regulator [Kitasatospora viridis]|uniref:AraC-like DNA-binding protein n=1 Tax=Kitasatospora viridis TaxID=281105 RepID=A0A561UC69_9ACTN|nr:AraC family transcriptional regulator [Kitasatospora viridis]TWF96953.1 AraC-like DNA-binding protein [Kitasatospora viridis]